MIAAKILSHAAADVIAHHGALVYLARDDTDKTGVRKTIWMHRNAKQLCPYATAAREDEANVSRTPQVVIRYLNHNTESDSQPRTTLPAAARKQRATSRALHPTAKPVCATAFNF